MVLLKNCIAVLVGGCFLSTAAYADVGVATLSSVTGKVLVNTGEGFVPASLEMTLKAGDRVLVGEESSAVVAYADCAVVLDKPAVSAISGATACETPVGATIVQPVADVYDPSAVAPTFAGIPPVVLLTTVAITAVTCAVACKKIFGKKKNNTPVSVR